MNTQNTITSADGKEKEPSPHQPLTDLSFSTFFYIRFSDAVYGGDADGVVTRLVVLILVVAIR